MAVQARRGQDPIEESFGGRDDGLRAQDISVVRVKNRPYAVDLTWNEVENKGAAAAEARETAARPGIEADLYCMRSDRSQYGLGYKANHHLKNMLSLAGQLADNRGGSWLGVYEVPEGHYVVAVRENLVLPNTDRVIVDEMELRTLIDDVMPLIDEGSEIHAPDALRIPGTTEVALEDIVGTKGPRLVETNRVGALTKWLFVGLLIAVLLFGLTLWMQHQAELDRAREWAAEQARLESLRPQQEQIIIPPMPWEGRALAGPWIETCTRELAKAVLVVPGWRVGGLSCEGASVSQQLVRAGDLGEGGGTINWVRWALDQSGMSAAAASPVSGTEVVVSWPLDAVEQHPIDVDTPRVSEARRYLQSNFEEAFTAIDFSSSGGSEYVMTLNFRVETAYDPRAFNSILTRVPGLTIDRISLEYKASQLVYIVEGAVHEQLPLPEGAIRASLADSAG